MDREDRKAILEGMSAMMRVESRRLPVEHTVVPQGMGHRIQPGLEPMVVLSLADFNRLEPTIPVRISFLQELAKKECKHEAAGGLPCDDRVEEGCCEPCLIRQSVEHYLAMYAREVGPS